MLESAPPLPAALTEHYLNQIPKSTLLSFRLFRKHPSVTAAAFVPSKIVSVCIHITGLFILWCLWKTGITSGLREVCKVYMGLWSMARLADKGYLSFCLPLVDGLDWIFYESCTHPPTIISTFKHCMCRIEMILNVALYLFSFTI